MLVDINAIKWLLENDTAYSISKNCGLSTQAVDKYKNGISDIMNMRLKHAIKMTEYANRFKKEKWWLYNHRFFDKKYFIYTKNNLWLPSNADCFSSFINQRFKEIIVPINFYQFKKDVFNFVFIARTIERTSPRAFLFCLL